MKLYFLKAEYTDGIYNLSDFYLNDQYKLIPSKMQDIDLKADDGFTNAIVNTLLPDNTKVNDHSHIIVPEMKKIYEIDKCLYLNDLQTKITLIEDSFIGNYQEIKNKKIRISRSNDESLFNGIHDIEDISVRPNLETKGTGITLTGQWVVYFIDTSSISPEQGEVSIYKTIKDKTNSRRNTIGEAQLSYYDSDLNLTSNDPEKNLLIKYPEIITDDPLKVDYFNKTIRGTSENITYTSIYYKGKIKWVEDNFKPYHYVKDGETYYKRELEEIKINSFPLLNRSIPLAPDLTAVALAFPFEKGIGIRNDNNMTFLPYTPEVANAIRSNGWTIKGIKIMNETQLFKQNTKVIYNDDWNDKYSMVASKNIDPTPGGYSNAHGTIPYSIYDNQGPASTKEYPVPNERNIMVLQLSVLNSEILLNIPTGNDIFQYEPFSQYKVNVFGKDYQVAKKNLNSLRIRFAPTLGMIEYFGYINNDLSQKIFSDSYTTDIKWSMDEVDIFNQQNPTYKDQFNSNMLRKSANIFATAGKGAAAGMMVGSLPGAAVGAGLGVAVGIMNLGFDLTAEDLKMKALELLPDQTFGDGSNISLASQTKYGLFVHKYTSDFEDSMKIKYELTGFPTTKIKTINELSQGNTTQFGKTKLIKGQLLEVVRNKYTTNEINKKLQEGVILI